MSEIDTGPTQEETIRKEKIKRRQREEAKRKEKEKGFINKLVDTDALLPSDDTLARLVDVTGTSVAEQILRTVGEPFIVKIENLYIYDGKLFVVYHREDDAATYDSTQPPVGCFNACTLVLAYMRFPSILTTFEKVMLHVTNSTSIKDANDVDQPVVVCEAKLSDSQFAEITPHLETPAKVKNVLEGHESRMQPGFEVTLDRVLESESERSQGLVIVNPQPEGIRQSITQEIINKADFKDTFVSIHTKMENFRQISAGRLYIDKGYYVINSAPFVRQISQELSGGALELREMVTEENTHRKKFTDKGVAPPEKKTYLVLLALRGFGLSPKVSNAIELNVAKAITEPLSRANDQISKQLNDKDGPYRKILADVKGGVEYLLFYLIGGLFLLNVFSGVTTQAINQFARKYFGIRSPQNLKPRSLKRLKQKSRSKKKKK